MHPLRWRALAAACLLALTVAAASVVAMTSSAFAEGDGVVTAPGLVAAGLDHSCALLSPGEATCWGRGDDGRLGYGNTHGVADGIGPALTAAGPLDLGGTATAVAAGDEHSCALLSSGKVRCWGEGEDGRLGYTAAHNVGDSARHTISAAGAVKLSQAATAISVGGSETCALLQDAGVTCWGRLEPPHAVELPAAAVSVAAGTSQSCAALIDGAVDCWTGTGAAHTIALSDLGQQVAVGEARACALLEGGGIDCWTGTAQAAPVDLARPAIDLAVGGDQACATVDDASVWCWTGTASPAATGVKAEALSVGADHACAFTTSARLACWGSGAYGKLGVGDVVDRRPDGTATGAGSASTGPATALQTFGGTTQAAAKADASGRSTTGHQTSAVWWLLAIPALAGVAGLLYFRRRQTGITA